MKSNPSKEGFYYFVYYLRINTILRSALYSSKEIYYTNWFSLNIKAISIDMPEINMLFFALLIKEKQFEKKQDKFLLSVLRLYVAQVAGQMSFLQ